MAQMECPICRKSFEREQSRALPFCGDRCRQIDLGRWLGEEQRLPYVNVNDDEVPELPPGDDR